MSNKQFKQKVRTKPNWYCTLQVSINFFQIKKLICKQTALIHLRCFYFSASIKISLQTCLDGWQIGTQMKNDKPHKPNTKPVVWRTCQLLRYSQTINPVIKSNDIVAVKYLLVIKQHNNQKSTQTFLVLPTFQLVGWYDDDLAVNGSYFRSLDSDSIQNLSNASSISGSISSSSPQKLPKKSNKTTFTKNVN